MSTVTLTIDNEAAVKRLRQYATLVGNWRVANKKIAIQLYGWVLRNYETEGSLVGGWAPIARATAKGKSRKGYSERILLRTGVLKNNYAFYSNEQEAGAGNKISYSLFHEEGVPKRGLPPRRQMPAADDMTKVAEEVLGFHVKSAIDQSINR